MAGAQQKSELVLITTKLCVLNTTLPKAKQIDLAVPANLKDGTNPLFLRAFATESNIVGVSLAKSIQSGYSLCMETLIERSLTIIKRI